LPNLEHVPDSNVVEQDKSASLQPDRLKIPEYVAPETPVFRGIDEDKISRLDQLLVMAEVIKASGVNNELDDIASLKVSLP